jgi:hypothetical protein
VLQPSNLDCSDRRQRITEVEASLKGLDACWDSNLGFRSEFVSVKWKFTRGPLWLSLNNLTPNASSPAESSALESDMATLMSTLVRTSLASQSSETLAELLVRRLDDHKELAPRRRT